MALQPSAAAPTAIDESALSQNEVEAALQALKQHLESGKPLGKNENGEDFVEIQEVWEDGIQPPPLAEEEGGAIIEEEEEELSSGFITDDDDHFDSLMEEIEALELDDEAVSKSLPGSTGTGGTQQQATTAGLKRGFLLDSSTSTSAESGTSRAAADIAKAATPLPAAASSANRDSRDAPFIGGVVEREPGSGSSRPPSHSAGSSGSSSSAQNSGDRIESDASAVEQPRISRFKQQRYGGY